MDVSSPAPAAYSTATTDPSQYLAAKTALSMRTSSDDITVESSAVIKGKASAPGQIAMSLKADIAATGADLSFNIQGKLASSIAKGADPQALFLAFAVTVDTGDVSEPEGKIPVEEPPVIDAEITEPDDAGSGPIPVADIPADDFGLASAEVALALLTGETESQSILDKAA